MSLPPDAMWRHAFDAVEAGIGEISPGLGRAAAFLDIMSEAGAEAGQLEVAVVVHGPAIFDVVNPDRHTAEVEGSKHPTAEVVERLISAGGEVWVCARAASWHDVGDDDLLPGVRFAPSAMAAHADLQRRGFSINPY